MCIRDRVIPTHLSKALLLVAKMLSNASKIMMSAIVNWKECKKVWKDAGFIAVYWNTRCQWLIMSCIPGFLRRIRYLLSYFFVSVPQWKCKLSSSTLEKIWEFPELFRVFSTNHQFKISILISDSLLINKNPQTFIIGLFNIIICNNSLLVDLKHWHT